MASQRVSFNKSDLKEFGGDYDGPTEARKHVEATRDAVVTAITVAEQQNSRNELTYDVEYEAR